MSLDAVAERRTRAMGADLHVLVRGAAPDVDDLADEAVCRVRSLEALWSRFIPTSDVSRANRADGAPVVVSAETFDLVGKAVAAWRLTAGRFDPTLLGELIDLGYDRNFDDVVDVVRCARPSRRAGWCHGIELDPEHSTIRLPASTGFDPGGIGKGFAADLVSAEAVANGATGVLVNVGGDLRVRGCPPAGDRWIIRVSEPTVSDRTLATVAVAAGGLATSTTRKRRWCGPEGERHHLIDRQTGRPHEGGADLVTVVAADAWWAEAAATALIGRDPIRLTECAALRILPDLTEQRLGGFNNYELNELVDERTAQ